VFENKELKINLTCNKEYLLDSLSKYEHPYDYIRICRHDKHDVCLALTWRQHTKPFVEYYYLADVVDNQLVGKIVTPRKSNLKIDKTKLSLVEKIQIAGFLLLTILMIYGLPFGIVYLISEKLFLSLVLGGIPLVLLVAVSILSESHIIVHKQNIAFMIHELQIDRGNEL